MVFLLKDTGDQFPLDKLRFMMEGSNSVSSRYFRNFVGLWKHMANVV